MTEERREGATHCPEPGCRASLTAVVDHDVDAVEDTLIRFEGCEHADALTHRHGGVVG